MKCLVTGSEGFIGKNLVEYLRAQDHHVIEWDSKNGTDGDLLKLPKMIPDDLDVIYHLACVNQMSAVFNPTENLDVNAFATRYLAKEAAKIGARFVYTSTASVYGNARHIPTPVECFPEPITDYAVAKLAGEHFVKNSGADYRILRLSNVYGPHQTLDNPYCGVIGRFIQSTLAGKPLQIIGDGHQTRDFTYVDDVVREITGEQLIGDRRTENLSFGQETSVIQLAGLVAQLLGQKTEIEFIEKRPIDSVDRRCLKGLHTTTNLKTGLCNTIKWFKENDTRETNPT